MGQSVVPSEDPMDTSPGAIGERLDAVLFHQGFDSHVRGWAVRLDVHDARGRAEDHPEVEQPRRNHLRELVDVVCRVFVPVLDRLLWSLGPEAYWEDSYPMPTEVGGSADARRAILSLIHAIVDLSGVSKIKPSRSGGSPKGRVLCRALPNMFSINDCHIVQGIFAAVQMAVNVLIQIYLLQEPGTAPLNKSSNLQYYLVLQAVHRPVTVFMIMA